MASDPVGFAWAQAFLPEQRFLGYWSPRQLITLELSADGDHDDEPSLAVCGLDPGEARELAFRLLVLADQAEHRARGGA